MKVTFWEQLRNAAFKNDLHIQGLQSIIKTQQGIIEELRKDKQWLQTEYNRLVADRVTKEIEVPLDTTPMDDKEHWKPLRNMPELPSQRRARLEAQSKERKKKIDAEARQALEAQ